MLSAAGRRVCRYRPVRFAVWRGFWKMEPGSAVCYLPSCRATIDKYTEDVAVDSQRFCMLTGFVPRYDLASGWRETVAEMRQAGDL